MKKKKRLAMLAQQEKQAQKPAEKKFLTPADCDVGASPQISKGNVYSKKHGGGGKMSPLVHADKFKLGVRKQKN